VAAGNGVPNLDACRLHAQRQTALMRVLDACNIGAMLSSIKQSSK
jgi:hypothetical protein